LLLGDVTPERAGKKKNTPEQKRSRKFVMLRHRIMEI